MTSSRPFASQRQTIARFLLNYWLPIGWFALLSGMFWIGDRRLYHTLFYAGLAAPTALLLLLQPKQWRLLKTVTLLPLFLLFAAYMLLSLLWSGTDSSWLSLAKRPVYIALLFAAVALLAHQAQPRLLLATESAALAAASAAVLSIAYYYYLGEGGRLTGYGALYNPLTSTHVFGFFTVYWLVRWYQHPTPLAWGPLAALLPLGVLLLLTDSRTPLVAVAAALLWMATLQWRQRLWLIIGTAIAVGLLWQLLHPVADLPSRGLSYRPAIWAEALRQLQGHLWFGLGLDHPQVFKVAGLGEALADTHNIEIAVLFEGGLVGLGLWVTMYVYALVGAWHQRQCNEVLMASTLVVFGLVAGLAEGGGFLSRPKEAWFLLWIPLTLLAAALSRHQQTQQAPKRLAVPVAERQLR